MISLIISFYQFSKKKEYITIEEFKNLELFGGNLNFCEKISKRIFNVIDSKKEKRISFQVYIRFIYILTYGSMEEKSKISFKMIDLENKGKITEDELKEFFYDILEYKKMFSLNINENYLENLNKYSEFLYNSIDLKNKGYFNYNDYKKKYFENPEYLTLFLNWDDIKIHLTKIKQSKEKLDEFKNSLIYIKYQLNKITETFDPIKKNQNKIRLKSVINENISKKKKKRIKCKTQFFKYENIDLNKNLNLDFMKKDKITIKSDKNHINNIKESSTTNEEYKKNLNKVEEFNDFNIIEPIYIEQIKLNDQVNDVSCIEKFKNKVYFENNIKNIINYTNDLIIKVNKEWDEKDNTLKQNDLDKKLTFVNIPKIKDLQKNSVVFLLNKNWTLISFMMIGIQKSINSNVNLHEKIRKIDFKSRNKYDLSSSNFGDNKKSIKKCFFYDYANNVFNSIRNFFNIKNNEFIKSIGNDILIKNLLQGNLKSFSEMTSSGKSGSFFYYSFDGKYVLKTIRKDEFKFMKKILPNYYNHLKNNKNSLITIFFGLYKICFKESKSKFIQKIYFIIMKNAFDKNYIIDERYDLKGSTYKRVTFSNNSSIAKKDLNFLKEKKNISINPIIRNNLLKQIENDVKFLEINNIIDYSLLLGIHKVKENEIFKEDNLILNEFISNNKKEIYLISFIDILTSYNTFKVFEHYTKKLFLGNGISCMPPKKYSNRFLNFFNNIIKS